MFFRIILLVLFPFSVCSQDLTPAERMLNAMGIDQVLEQARSAQARAAKEQVAMVMRQLEGTLSKLPKEDVAKIEKLFQDMMIQINNSWSTEQAIKVYSKAWSDNYSEKEILAIAEKYESDSAQKELQMLLKASGELNSYIVGSYSKSLEETMAKTFPQMQEIIKQGMAKNKSKDSASNE